MWRALFVSVPFVLVFVAGLFVAGSCLLTPMSSACLCSRGRRLRVKARAGDYGPGMRGLHYARPVIASHCYGPIVSGI